MSEVATVAALPSAQQSATSSIQRAVGSLRKDAHDVANSSGVASRETIQALLDSRQQLIYTQAAAKIISVSDEMQKSLIDIRV
jgi:hypothetical protein